MTELNSLNTFHLASPSRTIQDQCRPLQSDFIPVSPSLFTLNHISESLRTGLPIVVFYCYSYGSSDGKESTCSVGELGSIPGLERSPGEGNDYPLQYSCLGFPGGSDGKESTCSVGDLGLILGLGRFPGEGNLLEKVPGSCLENSMDRGAW